MKAFNPIAIMKKYKLWIIGLSLLAGALCFFFLNRQQSYTATAILEYTNPEASEGKAPDGTDIDPSEIYSTEVMKQVFARMDMDYGHYNLDKFRSKVVVKEILSEEEEAIQTALNEKGEAMATVPTKYSVSLTLDKKDVADPQVFARQMLDNILDVYLSVYGENHVSGTIQVNDIVRMEESDFDYIEAVEEIDRDVTSTLNSLANSISKSDSFRSTSVGYSLEDLYREFLLVRDRDIPNLYAYVLSNHITKNAEVLTTKYSQRIEDYSIENEANLRLIEDIKQVIDTYVLMMRESGNTSITYEYILDEVYDTFYQNRMELDEKGEPVWQDPDETIEYEMLLESYVENRTAYEHALIDIAYCSYIIDTYAGVDGAVVSGTDPEAEQRINDLTNHLDELYANLAVVKSEYNAYSGASNVGLITNIVVNANVQVILYTLILLIAFFVVISAAVIVVDRTSEILNYYIYVDRKFGVGNRSACDRYLAGHERTMLKGDTSVIAINLTGLRDKNKAYGRDACDSMIRALADNMKRIFPGEPDGFIAMNGQGQFVVFLMETSETQAKAYMQYLDKEVKTYNADAACPIEYHYGISEAQAQEIFQLRSLLVNAVNKANSTSAVNN